MNDTSSTYPLISVIIPSYNHETYLPKAVNSVLGQSYPNIEIIVINDGSADDTDSLMKHYPQVQYISQENKGLAASRNIGLQQSHGDYIVFLDADDWLLPQALFTNYKYLVQKPDAAMVSGGHIFYYQPEAKEWDIQKPLAEEPYLAILKGNYIGMPSCVMYNRWSAEAFPFNENLKHCEDYEQYFRILRKHTAIHHTSLIAVYRNHGLNKSGNIPLVFETALNILKSQESFLKSGMEREAWEMGMYWLAEYYCDKLYNKLVDVLYKNRVYINTAEKEMLRQYRPHLLEQYDKELEIAAAYFATLE